MDKENNLKVDSFIQLGNVHNIHRISHGTADLYSGNCLVEYNGELYLADTWEEQIYTDEGSGFNFSGMGKHEAVLDITRELGLPWIDEGNTNISYKYIDGIKKISEDGQLSEVSEYDLYKKLKDLISFSMSTNARNYMSYDEEYYEEYGEYKDISIDSSLSNIDSKGLDITEGYDSINISKDTMPYGKINASLEIIENKPILHLNGKEYDLDKLINNAQPVAKPTRTSEIAKEQQELIEVLSEQQKKIETQEKELADLKSQNKGEI